MKPKHLMFLFVLTLSIVFLTACGNKSVSKPKSFKSFELNYAQPPVYKDMQGIETISGQFVSQSGNLAYFKDYDYASGYYTHYIYNLSKKYLFEYSDNIDYTIYDIEMATINGVSLYSIIEEMKDPNDTPYWTLIYDEFGNSLGNYAKRISMYTTCDLVYFGNVAYTEKNGEIVTAIVRNSLPDQYPEFDYRIGSLYYEEVSSKLLIQYNQNGSIVQSFTVPSYASNSVIFPLASNDILIQYTYKVSNESIDYDLYQNNQKYKIVTQLIDDKTGKTTNLKSDFLFIEGHALNSIDGSSSFDSRLNSKVKTVALGYIIDSNKQIDTSVKGEYVLSISNKGKIEKALNCYVNDQGFNMPIAITKNRFIVFDEWDRTYCFDEKGSLLRDITNKMYTTSSYLITNDKEVFNWNFSPIYDMEKENASIVKTSSNFILFNKNGEYFFLNEDGTEKTVSSTGNVDTYLSNLSGNDYFVFRLSDFSYVYYNANGERFYQGNEILTYLCSSQDSKTAIFVDGYSKYYLSNLE